MSDTRGVLLLTFGSAVTSDDVPQYLRSVRGGRTPSDDVVAEFRRRYDIIGRSPLIEIAVAQVSALQALLDEDEGAGRFFVAMGMLHSAPHVAGAVDQLVRAGVKEIVAIVLAPQYSPIILAGYERAIAAARERYPHVRIEMSGTWSDEPLWLDSLAERLSSALAALPAPQRGTTPVIFTAHSLPRAVVERDPEYIEQLKETAQRVADRAELAHERWQFAYQSAGHTPEEWLKPDVKDVLPALRDAGHSDVLVAPVQFLADHLEILYDIDVAARAEAAALGIRMHRIAMPNTSPTFIKALRAVVRRELGARSQAAVEDAVVGERR
jgi:ferrochelatase